MFEISASTEAERLRRIIQRCTRIQLASEARSKILVKRLREVGYASIHDTKHGDMVYYETSNTSYSGWVLTGAVQESAAKPIANLELGREIREYEYRTSSRNITQGKLISRLFDAMRYELLQWAECEDSVLRHKWEINDPDDEEEAVCVMESVVDHLDHSKLPLRVIIEEYEK